jgi:hypothetical protein
MAPISGEPLQDGFDGDDADAASHVEVEAETGSALFGSQAQARKVA